MSRTVMMRSTWVHALRAIVAYLHDVRPEAIRPGDILMLPREVR